MNKGAAMKPDTQLNVDPAEVAKFDQSATRWCASNSEYKPLHDINPLRLDYIDQRAGLAGKKVIDVGCGGGILAESMAMRGAEVTGIDMAAAALSVAKLHALEAGVKLAYRQVIAEQWAETLPGAVDVGTCMEVLELVPDPAALIHACAALVKPGGHVFFSTLNRHPK